MADNRLTKAWREWVVEESPEAAQRYCVELARAEQAPAPATILSSIDWASLQRNDAARDAIYQAAKAYLGMEPGETCLEELSWVSEEHYFLLGGVSPSVMRDIAKVYKDHGLKLKTGDEDEAEEDHARAKNITTRFGAARIRELERKLSILKDERDNCKQMRDYYQGEFKKVSVKLEQLQGDRKAQLDFDGLQASYDILIKENKRLSSLLQAGS